MKENQEQKSQSESTKEGKLEGIVTEAMATPFRSMVPLEYEQLRKAFDAYWKAHGTEIKRQFKFKGKNKKSAKGQQYLEKTVGCTKLYKDVLCDEVVKLLDDPLFFTVIHLEEFTPERTLVVCVYYKYPTINLVQEIDFNLERKINYDREEAWKGKCEDLQRKYRTTSTYEGDETINETQQVFLDLTASCEGKPYSNATVQGLGIDVADVVVIPLKEGLLKHRKGDLFEISFENEEKKQVDVQVKIHDVEDIQVPEVDDELAKDAGFDDLSTLQEQFYKEYDQYVENAEESQACDHILTEIITKSEFGPVPNEYITLNVDRSIKDFVNSHRGDQRKAMRSIGATDENHMRYLFTGQVHQVLYQKLAMKCYATKYKLDVEDRKSILADMRRRVTWNEKSKV